MFSPHGNGAASPVGSSSSTMTGLANSPASCGAAASASGLPSSGSRDAAAISSGYIPAREWLYRLVTFPSYFTPCRPCTVGCRTPRREQLLTLFDMRSFRVHCAHCTEARLPGCPGSDGTARGSGFGPLLQVRRSAFKDVVKASDIGRYGADVGGVQQYTLNGSKVIYLNREQAPERKPGAACTAPAQCSVDGRAMMDKSSLYCSIKCKLIAEDPGFTTWLDSQDPSVRILAHASATAPPRPTAACKRGGGGGMPAPAMPVASSASSDDSGLSYTADRALAAGGGSRPRKVARTGSDTNGTGSSPAWPGGMRRVASACMPLPVVPPLLAPSPVRTAPFGPCGGNRQHSAPGPLLDVLGHGGHHPPSWSGPGSPSFAALAAYWGEQEDDGSISPTLLGSDVCAADEWWTEAADCCTPIGFGGGLARVSGLAAVNAVENKDGGGCADAEEADDAALLLLVPPRTACSSPEAHQAAGLLLPPGCGETLSGAALVLPTCCDSVDSSFTAAGDNCWLGGGGGGGGGAGGLVALSGAHSAPAGALDSALLACGW